MNIIKQHIKEYIKNACTHMNLSQYKHMNYEYIKGYSRIFHYIISQMPSANGEK